MTARAEEQGRQALDAFARNGFFVLVGDRQAESLDEEFTITPETEVSFVKLVEGSTICGASARKPSLTSLRPYGIETA